MSRASLSVACAVAGLVSLAGLAGCASVDSIGASIGAVPLHDTVKGAFIDTAIDRVKVHYRLAPGVSNPRSMPGPITTTRAFSGEPSLKSQDDLRIVEESGGIVESRPAQLYLQQVLDRLLAHWPYETPRIGVFITSTPAFGAVATGEGDILINAGSLLAFSSEDELAAMLAHEAAHILLKHHARSEQVKANKRMMNAIAEMALTYTMVRNTRFQKVGRGQFVVPPQADEFELFL